MLARGVVGQYPTCDESLVVSDAILLELFLFVWKKATNKSSLYLVAVIKVFVVVSGMMLISIQTQILDVMMASSWWQRFDGCSDEHSDGFDECCCRINE